MNKKSLAVAGAIAFATFFTNIANAIPIRFEFTGSVSSTTGPVSELGQPMSGYVTFDTEGLEARRSTIFPVTAIDFGHWPTTPGPSGFSAGITVAGNALPVEGVWNEGRVGFFDGCTPDCLPGYGESFGISTVSRGRPDSGLADGRFYDVSFSFLSVSIDPITGRAVDYFEITPEFDAAIVLTLPLRETVGLYSATIWDCVQGECIESHGAYNFRLDTVTRTTTSVPEPGTLGLLGASVLGMWALRRRTRTPVLLSRD